MNTDFMNEPLTPSLSPSDGERVASRRVRGFRFVFIRVHSWFASKFHRRQIFNVRGLAFAVERDDERQPDRHFRRRDGDDEENQNLSVQVVVEARERNEREIRGVKHQFQRHINHQQIAPQNDAEQAEAKQRGADDEIMFQAYSHNFLAAKERKERKETRNQTR